jgi:hypothetical protein
MRDVDQKTGRDLLALDPARPGAAGGGKPLSGLQGISGIRVNPDDFSETVKRWV